MDGFLPPTRFLSSSLGLPEGVSGLWPADCPRSSAGVSAPLGPPACPRSSAEGAAEGAEGVSGLRPADCPRSSAERAEGAVRARSFHAVWGPRGISSWALEALCPLLSGSVRVLWVDAANRFDAHGLAKAAWARGLDARAVLGRVQVARPFNAFQLTALVTDKLPRLAPAPVVLADPLAPFYDDELPLEDARRAFERFRLGLAGIPGPVVALLVGREAPIGRREFAPRLVARAASVLRLDDPEAGAIPASLPVRLPED